MGYVGYKDTWVQGYEDTGDMWDTSIHGLIHDPRIRWDARILGIRGYVGYKDTWDTRIIIIG